MLNVVCSDHPSTPHARGSTLLHQGLIKYCKVYPACAGIHRLIDISDTDIESLPRMRGDPPQAEQQLAEEQRSTPHARGSTSLSLLIPPRILVYPACAGIHLKWCKQRGVEFRLPRMRGDPPRFRLKFRPVPMSTPHARGSTRPRRTGSCASRVYPACAGIHLKLEDIPEEYRGLPRMRGDPPSPLHLVTVPSSSTPHARGSTRSKGQAERAWAVYPACAGIHPHGSGLCTSQYGLPRMRGDPPARIITPGPRAVSTPHARGST